jgi:hypothetical protein
MKKEFKKLIDELFKETKNDYEKISKRMDDKLKPLQDEQIKNAEVSTPYELRQNMIDFIPIEFWKSKKKVFEPCSGKGAFLVDIFNMFKKHSNLTDKVILEECIYFADINPLNIYINKKLLDPKNKYKLNFYDGDTLKLDEKHFNTKFDLIIGNPPYNSSGKTGTGNTIYQHFIRKSLNEWIKPNGYLSFVHPSSWRKPDDKNGKTRNGDLFKLMCHTNNMLNLVMRNVKDGMKTFKCGTRYDYYLIKAEDNFKKAFINDDNYVDYHLDLKEFSWLPNSNILKIKELINLNPHNELNVLSNRLSADSRKTEFIRPDQDETYKYKLIHSTNKTGIRYFYSKNKDKGHFNTSKIIFGSTGLNDVIIDIEGDYGATNSAICMGIEFEEESNKLKTVLLSDEFKIILKSCIFGNFGIDFRLFLYFKKLELMKL